VAVIRAQVPEVANVMVQRVQSEFRVKEMFVEKLSIGIVVHLGPGTVGLVAYLVE
jgi:fatty acid-binding protein DegV